MPRKALDMRKTCGRLFAKGKKKAPQGRDTWRIAINTARLRGSCQEHRGINSRLVSANVYHDFHLFFLYYRIILFPVIQCTEVRA